MAKITLNPIVGSYASVTALNARFQQIEDAFNDDVLWRDGFVGETNAMAVDLDMAGNDLLNVSLIEFTDVISYATEWANKAEDSLISAAAGGDEVDDYSALHHSAKAAEEVVLAAAQVTLAEAEVVKTNADVVLTGLDVDATNADVVLTNVDVVLTNNKYDEFDDRYLGAKASEPTLDNDGDALMEGAIYFNTTSNIMRVYSGSAWGDIGTAQNSASSVNIADAGGYYTATDVEGMGQEIIERVGGLNTLPPIDIGDWNMDSTNFVSIPHGLPDYTKIRTVSVFIRNDNNAGGADLLSTLSTETDKTSVEVSTINIILRRGPSGYFDNTLYDSTSYNRGWITIQYID